MKTHRILLWGNALKKDFHSALQNKLQKKGSGFELDSLIGSSHKIDKITIQTEMVRKVNDDQNRFEIYFIAYKTLATKSKRHALDWLDDYTENEKEILRKIYSDTDAIVFIANAKRFVEDKKSFSTNPINEWERTKHALKLLKEVAGDDLATIIPLYIVIIRPDEINPSMSMKSEIITENEMQGFLESENLWSEKTMIIKTSDILPKLSTTAFKIFVDWIQSIEFTK